MAEIVNEENQVLLNKEVENELPAEEVQREENPEREEPPAKRLSLPTIASKAASWELPEE